MDASKHSDDHAADASRHQAGDGAETTALSARILERARDGDSSAVDELLPLVYANLRALAGSLMRGQASSHTLQPTALVNEAYLKLVSSGGGWKDRAHFCAIAAVAMRQILRDHARGKRAAKRDASAAMITVDSDSTDGGTDVFDLVALDEAMTKLAALDARQAHIVELRFFGGLGHAEIAEVIGVSERTVKSDWRRVRAWLSRELSDEDSQ